MSGTTKPVNQKAWFLILPVLLCVAFSAIVPLMTVVNYSVQDIISPERRVFVGTEWFAAVMRDEDLHSALWRQLTFSLAVLLVEIPLGILLALSMPAQGWKASAVLVTVALSLLIPWNVVGTIWQIYGRTDIGLLGAALQWMGVDYNYTGNATDAWVTVLVMDVWHWTPFVTLTMLAGLTAIPKEPLEQAQVDGANRFQVLRFLTIPMMMPVIITTLFIRIMDALRVMDEVFLLTGGGPANATRYIGILIWRVVFPQTNYGYGSAMSLLVLYMTLVLAFLLFSVLSRVGKQNTSEK